jgi:hypothetical protein
VVIADSRTGEQADPVLVDRNSGRLLAAPDFRSAAGPAADAHTRHRYDLAAKQAAAEESSLAR